MKVLKLVLFTCFILLIYSCSESQKKEVTTIQSEKVECTFFFNPDSTIKALKKELTNDEIYKSFKILTDSMINKLESLKESQSSNYPFINEIDSSVIYKVNSDLEVKKLGKLNDDQIIKVNKLLNNPLYFEWGECGTPVENYTIDYYENNLKIATIYIACENNFIMTEPHNVLTRHGGLTEEGRNLINCFLDEVN